METAQAGLCQSLETRVVFTELKDLGLHFGVEAQQPHDGRDCRTGNTAASR